MNPLFAMHDSQLSAVAGNLKGIDKHVPQNAAAGARDSALAALKAAGISWPPNYERARIESETLLDSAAPYAAVNSLAADVVPTIIPASGKNGDPATWIHVQVLPGIVLSINLLL